MLFKFYTRIIILVLALFITLTGAARGGKEIQEKLVLFYLFFFQDIDSNEIEYMTYANICAEITVTTVLRLAVVLLDVI